MVEAVSRPRIGVLGLQGDFAAHARALGAVGAEAVDVRSPGDLSGLAGLILPGGESTALLRLMRPERMDGAIRDFHANGGVLFGTCAGLILLAARVENPEQESLGLLDVTVSRNAYGRQVDSFVARGRVDVPAGEGAELEMFFIRAPRITAVGPAVRILGEWGGAPVLVQSGRILAATFHPEMGEDRRVHGHFVEMSRRP